jgi:hypothetical protein
MVKAGYKPLFIKDGLYYLYSLDIQEGLRKRPDEIPIDIVLLYREQCSEVKMPFKLFKLLKPYKPLFKQKNLKSVIIPFGKDRSYKIRLYIRDFGLHSSHDSKLITELGNLFSLKSDGLYLAYLY